MTEVHSPLDEMQADGEGGLAATLASRICHDLASPLGAIANGLELLALAGLEPSPEMALVSQSVESANARLRFFRIAYGAAGTKALGRPDVMRTLASLSKGTRIAYDWDAPAEQPRQEVKAIFLLFQCLDTVLPAGGRIAATRSGDGWTVRAEGPRVRFDPMMWEIFGPHHAPPPSGSAQVQFALLAITLVELGRRLDVTASDDGIVVRL